MKKIIIGCLIVFNTNLILAQKLKESEVPKVITDSFNKNFKGTKVEKWEREKDGNYEAEFDFNKIETSASFSAEGQLLETESEIKINQLPKSIGEYINKNYPTHKISEASKILDSKGMISYEAEIEKGKDEFDLLFDSEGNFIRKEVEEHKD